MASERRERNRSKRKEERNEEKNRRVKWKEEEGRRVKEMKKGSLISKKKEMSDRGSTVRERKEIGIS